MRSSKRRNTIEKTTTVLNYRFRGSKGWRAPSIIAVDDRGERQIMTKPVIIPALGLGHFGWGGPPGAADYRLASCRSAAAVLHDVTDGDREIVHATYALLARDRFFSAPSDWQMSADHIMAWLVPALTSLEALRPTDKEWLEIQKMRRMEGAWGSLIGMTVGELAVCWERQGRKCPANVPEELSGWVLTHEFAGPGAGG